MKKSAFTVVEVLICLAIIGILIVVTLNVSNNKASNQYAKLYYAAYDSLVQAVGNAYLNWNADKYVNENDILSTCIRDHEYYHWSKRCWEIYTATYEKAELLSIDGVDQKVLWLDQIQATECKPIEPQTVQYTDENGVTYETEDFSVNTCNDETKWLKLTDIDGGGIKNTYESRKKYGGIEDYPRRYPGFLMGRQHDVGEYLGGRFDGWGTNQAFCKDIAQYYNTLNKKYECQYFVTGLKKEGDNIKDPMIGGNFHDVFCTLLEPHEDEAPTGNCADTPDGKIPPSFITSNGQRFYISGVATVNMPIFGSDQEKRERRYFRFVAVDLNGENEPNRQFAKGANFPWLNETASAKEAIGSYPDIVLFAITDTGFVIPLGLPEFSTSYATAKVYFPENFVNSEGNLVRNNNLTSTAMSLFDAKRKAWGKSGGDKNLIFHQEIFENNPMTYAEFFYMVALNCGVDGCSKKKDYNVGFYDTAHDDNKAPLYADPLMANLVRQFIFREENKPIGNGGFENTIIPSVVVGGADMEHGCRSNFSSKCKVQIDKD